MRKFRIHNDIPITWRIVDKQTLLPFDLEGKTVRLSLQSRFGMIPIEDFTVAGNVISFVFKASQQSTLGVYTATASITDAEGHTWTMDACQMLELVSQSCCADVCGSHGVDETSGVEFQQVIFVDSELNAESKNPVSNSAVTKAIQGIKSDTLVIDEKINREIEERKAENNVLSLRINQEEAKRKASDNSLGERIDSSVASLESLILEEGETREESDNALLEKINHETDGRKEAESLLYGRIEEESNQREEAYNALDGKISEEIEARKTADSAIVDRINALSDKAVQATPQNFSEEQKSQARENIGAPSKVGYYPKMSVGFSENISGDGSAVDAEFTFRPTAGENRNILNDGAARIKSIKGNSLVWNQLVKNGDLSEGIDGLSAFSLFDNERTFELFEGYVRMTMLKGASWAGVRFGKIHNNKGDKYLVLSRTRITPNEGETYKDFIPWHIGNSAYRKAIIPGEWVDNYNIETVQESGEAYVGVRLDQGFLGTIDIAYFVVFNLTKMFGAGNEPSTIEEFYSRIPSNIDMYAYNEGEIINNNVDGIKTVGFNQWDEEWELGRIDINTGLPTKGFTEAIRSKNYNRILPNKEYYLRGIINNTIIILFYDAEYNYISSLQTTNVLNQTFTTPANANYIKLYAGNSDSPITHYNNNICINLSWPEYAHLNGTYQSYKPFSLDLSWVKKYFPDGMKSAGSVYDEITSEKAIQRVGVVDLGNIDWTLSNDTIFKSTKSIPITDLKKPLGNEIIGTCAIYVYVGQSALSTTPDSISIFQSGRLWINDSHYTDAVSLKESLQGVMFYYELAEPIETPLEEPIQLDYDVEDFGTEEAISDEPSAPFKADIVYQPNALATIKNVPDLMVRISALEQALASLQSTQVEEKVIE